MSTYEIFPLINMYLEDTERSLQTYLQNFGIKVSMPVVFWLIKGNGRNILIDSGASSKELTTKNHYEPVQTEDMLPINLVKAHGVEPEDIDTIVITHLHWDHCYNLECFPNAKIYVQKTEVEYAINPLQAHILFYESAKSGIKAPWIAHIPRFEIIEGDFTLCEGIKVYLMPGHTPGMQNIAVNTTNGVYLIASDNIPTTTNWEGNGIHKHIPSSIHCNLFDYYKSLKKMEEICDHVLPSHDMKLAEYEVFPPKK